MVSTHNTFTEAQLNLFSDTLTVDQLDWASIVNRNGLPQSAAEGLQSLITQLEEGQGYLKQENWVASQIALENALSTMLITLKKIGMDPSLALSRSCNRLQNPTRQPVSSTNKDGFYIYPDRVSLKSDGHVRGEWPLYTQEDYDNFTRLAYELGYPIFHHDAKQLELL